MEYKENTPEKLLKQTKLSSFKEQTELQVVICSLITLSNNVNKLSNRP